MHDYHGSAVAVVHIAIDLLEASLASKEAAAAASDGPLLGSQRGLSVVVWVCHR